MSTVTLTSPCNANLSQTLSYENNNTHLRDASFSSYLSNAEENFVLKLPESTRNPSPTITAPQESHHQISLGRKNTEGDISVFGAEKYFNGGIYEGKPRVTEKVSWRPHSKKDEQINLHRVKPKIKLGVGTPSTCSEVSWNSQSALLPSRLTDQSPSKQNRVHGKRIFATFGCNCSCSDKKSVDINKNIGENKNPLNYRNNVECRGVQSKEIITKEPIKIDAINLVGIKQTQFKEDTPYQKFSKVSFGLNKEECSAFPVLHSRVGNLTVKRQLEEREEEEGKPRKSLEVFGSPILGKGNRNLNLERRLNMVTWDAIPRVQDIPANTSSGGMNEEIESDASSDLFEIESITGNANPFFTRQVSDGMSSCMTPTCYEPSEASIDWSVVTASAVNLSAASENDDQGTVGPDGVILTTTATTTTTTTTRTTTAKTEVQRRLPSILSGCRNHKAVNVAGSAYRVSEKEESNTPRRHRSDSLAPTAGFQGESKVTDFESVHAQRAFATRSHSQAYYARGSHSLYMN